jgi:hypothetical protein
MYQIWSQRKTQLLLMFIIFDDRYFSWRETSKLLWSVDEYIPSTKQVKDRLPKSIEIKNLNRIKWATFKQQATP